MKSSEKTAETLRERKSSKLNISYINQFDIVPSDQDADDEICTGSEHPFPGDLMGTSTVFTKGLTHDEYGRVSFYDIQKFILELHSDTRPDFECILYNGGYSRPSGSLRPRKLQSPFSSIAAPQDSGERAPSLSSPPTLGSPQLTTDLGEVYAAALLRDTPFADWSNAKKVAEIHHILNRLSETETTPASETERPPHALFRGTSKGADTGPYLSQFLLIGNAEKTALQDTDSETGPIAAQSAPSQDSMNRAATFVHQSPSQTPQGTNTAPDPATQADGYIRYGAQAICQRIHGHLKGLDHMTEWATWQDVQGGSNRKDSFDRFDPTARFMSTPRDLASYIHFAEHTQPFVNTALLLMGAEEPTGCSLPEGHHHPTSDGSAAFGLSHLLDLLHQVEQATLRAIFPQKYQLFLRARPERTAAAVALAWAGNPAARSLGWEQSQLGVMAQQLQRCGLLDQVQAHNQTMNQFWKTQYGDVDLGPLTEDRNALLPMAWPEGSPMSPAYGSARAAVAGACTTVLKAFFEMYTLTHRGEKHLHAVPQALLPVQAIMPLYPSLLFGTERPITGPGTMLQTALRPDPARDFTTLTEDNTAPQLTLQGELNKLAENISLAGLFAGINFRTDCDAALRFGERIAVAYLRSHIERFGEAISFRFHTFDGNPIVILNRPDTAQDTEAEVFLWETSEHNHRPRAFSDWYSQPT